MGFGLFVPIMGMVAMKYPKRLSTLKDLIKIDMDEIIKILSKFKEGKISLKELSMLLDIKKRGKFHLVKTTSNFQVWNKNDCFLSTKNKDEAETLVLAVDDLLSKIENYDT